MSRKQAVLRAVPEQLALRRRRDRLDVRVEVDTLDCVTHVAPVEHAGDIGQPQHGEAALVPAQAQCDA